MKFITTALLLAIPFFCFSQCEKNVSIEKNKYTGETTFTTVKILENPDKAEAGKNIMSVKKKVFLPVGLSKTDSMGKATFSLTAIVKGERGIFSPKGIFILFKDGSRIIKPDAFAMAQRVDNTIAYLSSIQLSEEEYRLLKTQIITDIKIDQYECSPSDWLGRKMLEIFSCL